MNTHKYHVYNSSNKSAMLSQTLIIDTIGMQAIVLPVKPCLSGHDLFVIQFLELTFPKNFFCAQSVILQHMFMVNYSQKKTYMQEYCYTDSQGTSTVQSEPSIKYTIESV